MLSIRRYADITFRQACGYLPSRGSSPFLGWYSFYRPMEGRRLSRPGISKCTELIFTKFLGWVHIWVGMIIPTISFRRKLAYPTFILCAGISQRIGGSQHMCARVNTADDPSTSDKDLVNFGLVTPDFSGAFAQGRGATR